MHGTHSQSIKNLKESSGKLMISVFTKDHNCCAYPVSLAVNGLEHEKLFIRLFHFKSQPNDCFFVKRQNQNYHSWFKIPRGLVLVCSHFFLLNMVSWLFMSDNFLSVDNSQPVERNHKHKKHRMAFLLSIKEKYFCTFIWCHQTYFLKGLLLFWVHIIKVYLIELVLKKNLCCHIKYPKSHKKPSKY